MSKLRDLTRREFTIDYKAIPPWISRNRVEVSIGLGIFFRVAQYLANRSYWLDESALAGNICLKTFLQLFGPLTNTQLAPPGFLVIEWVVSRTLGCNSIALRLLPLIGGIASLFVFRLVAEKAVRPGAVAIAVALFAFSDDLIYFASELKQYCTDVTIGLACTLMGLSLASQPLTLRRVLFLAAAGGAAVWFSHPAAFVLAGIGSVLFVQVLRRTFEPPADYGRDSQIRHLIIVGMFWSVSLVALRLISHRQLEGKPDMWYFWDFAFPPSVRSFEGVVWPIRRGMYLLVNPLDYYWPLDPRLMVILPLLLFVGGALSMSRRNPTALAMLGPPAGFAILASYARVFPFHGRLILFLVPAILLLIGEGAEWLCEVVRKRWFRVALMTSLLLFPVLGDIYHVAAPRIRSGLNPFGDRRPHPDPEKHPGFDPEKFPF